MSRRWRAFMLTALVLATACARPPAELQVGADPSPEEYLAAAGTDATIVPAGQLALDGRTQTCAARPTVLDPGLNDYAVAYPKFIILNLRLLAKVATPVKLWIYAHECGHHYHGPDETKADCYGVRRGRSEGWLTAEGLEQICAFIQPGRVDATHFAGAQRCELMRQCFRSAPNVAARPRRRAAE
jgi:hypothetical protein